MRILIVSDSISSKSGFGVHLLYLGTELCKEHTVACFAEKSQVLMSDFTTKNIEDIKAGDKILAFDEKPKDRSRKYRTAEVKEKLCNGSRKVVNLNGTRVTPDHKFLIYGRGRRRRWCDLKNTSSDEHFMKFPGDPIRNKRDYILGFTKGFIDSDGSWSFAGANHQLGFTLSQKDKTVLDEIKDALEDYNIEIREPFYEENAGAWRTGTHAKEPNRIILEASKKETTDFKKGYLAGFFIGDGGIYHNKKNNSITVTFYQRNEMEIIKRYLADFNIHFYTYNSETGEGTFKPGTTMFNIKVFSDFLTKIPVLYGGKKKENYQEILEKVTVGYKNILLEKAKQEFTIKEKEEVFDLKTSTGTYICDGYLVHNCHGLQHSAYEEFPTENGTIYVYPNEDLQHGEQKFGATNFHKVVEDFKPDVVLTLLDFHMVQHVGKTRYPEYRIVPFEGKELLSLEKVMNLVKEKYESVVEQYNMYKWHAVLPIDGDPIPYFWKESLDEVDQIIAMSDYGKEKLEEEGYDSVKIPHGVETEKFKPERERKTDYFIVGNINRNQHRKQIPRTIQAYKRFVEKENLGPEDTKLLLHMWKKDFMGWDLDFLVKTYGLEDYVIMPDEDPMRNPLSTEGLANLYNAMDVFLSTTGGEGYGYTTIESLSCGVPVVITDYTTSRELIGDNERGRLVEPCTYYWDTPERAGNQRALIDIEKTADALSEFYHMSQAEYDKLSNNARKFALERGSRKIGKQWLDFYEE